MHALSNEAVARDILERDGEFGLKTVFDMLGPKAAVRLFLEHVTKVSSEVMRGPVAQREIQEQVRHACVERGLVTQQKAGELFSELEPKMLSLTLQDLEAAILLWEKHLLHKKIESNLQRDQIEKGGFLVRPLTAEMFQKYMQCESSIMLKGESEKLDGALIAVSVKDWSTLFPGWENNVSLSMDDRKVLTSQKTLYCYAICTNPDSNGIAKNLSLEMERIAIAQGYENIIGTILEEPFLNRISMRFHGGLGYEKIGTVKDSFNDMSLTWALMCKKIAITSS